jgi:hypothetical protein
VGKDKLTIRLIIVVRSTIVENQSRVIDELIEGSVRVSFEFRIVAKSERMRRGQVNDSLAIERGEQSKIYPSVL